MDPLTADELIAFEISRYIRCWKICESQVFDDGRARLFGLRASWAISETVEPCTAKAQESGLCKMTWALPQFNSSEGLHATGDKVPAHQKSPCFSSSFSGRCPALALRDQLQLEQKGWILTGHLRRPEPK
jgi:hypothetical protein